MNKKELSYYYERIVLGIIFILLTFVIGQALLYTLITYRENDRNQPVTRVKVSYEDTTCFLDLPTKLSDIKPGTSVTVSFNVPKYATCLYFGSIYCPLEVSVDGLTEYRYGANYSSNMFQCPPLKYDMISLRNSGADHNIEMHYTSTEYLGGVILHSPLYGDSNAIVHHLFNSYGTLMLNSVFFTTIGAILIFFSLFYLKSPGRGRIFFWPGMLTFSAGIWQYSENQLAIYLTKSPAILYAAGLVCMYFLVIPLTNSTIYCLSLDHNKVLKVMIHIETWIFIITLFLALLGVLPLHKTFSYYQFYITFCLLILAITVIWELKNERQWTRVLFFIAIITLALASILEIINFYTHFLDQMLLIFQLALFIFALFIGLIGGFQARKIYRKSIITIELQNDMKLQAQTIDAEKKRIELLLAHYDEIRKQRHDLRHHLATMSELLKAKHYIELSTYLSSVEKDIPSLETKKYCENIVVNLAITYYTEQANALGISLDYNLEVSKNNTHISDSNLSVIFGNLLENAIHACIDVPEKSRFIKLNSQIRGEMLFITMDNSCSGMLSPNGDLYNSTKHQGAALGLRSLKSISERHGGSAKFNASENVFQSEICVRL